MPDFTLAAAALTACGLFGANGAYTQDIRTAAVDPNSLRYIKSAVGAGATSGLSIAADPVEFVNLADNRTPAVRVRPKVSWYSFNVPYPWSPGFRIEPLSDAHAIVVQTQSCRLYELYNASFTANALSAYGGAVWNLREPFAPLPAGKSSAMASGLSLYAGVVRWEEIARGVVPHALNLAITAGSAVAMGFRPAGEQRRGHRLSKGIPAIRYRTAHVCGCATRFDISRFGPQSAAIARAMKTLRHLPCRYGADRTSFTVSTRSTVRTAGTIAICLPYPRFISPIFKCLRSERSSAFPAIKARYGH